MVLLEVDEVNVACLKECQEELHRQMTDRFLFGKFEHQQADFAGRTVIFEDDRVLMHQQKYIVEKLQP